MAVSYGIHLQAVFKELFRIIMSKRKPQSVTSHIKPIHRRTFAELNAEMHSITVSTPILYLLQTLQKNKAFSDKVLKLLQIYHS